jgi:hypothetical protein
MEENIILNIYNADGTAFNNIQLHKWTFSSVVMSLDNKIDADFYSPSANLNFTLQEYVSYNGKKYTLKTPPTVVNKGLLKDSSESKGMVKYTCTFYSETIELYNIPFTDVAVDTAEKTYRSENKTFAWIGTLTELVAKINKCLTGTKWSCALQPSYVEDGTLSEVISFDNQMISDVLKTAYETFKYPYTEDGYVIYFGTPSNEILSSDGTTPFVFQLGQGLGLKNNDATPKNNTVITRIAGYGSEDNIPTGYPLIKWTGNQTWTNTLNDATGATGYPIIDAVIDGATVKVINHPFTRTYLMPTVYVESVDKKVNPNNANYNPDTKLVDYYDAVDDETHTYITHINTLAPVYQSETFDKIKPSIEGMTYNSQAIDILKTVTTPDGGWSDATDSENNYTQSYFNVTLYPLGFDLYAQAALTSAMSLSMRSGATIGCAFELGVDWDDVKANFYVKDVSGNLIWTPNGEQRSLIKYPDSTNAAITIKVKKDSSTFGTLLPNKYQYPIAGDKFVILGIEMPSAYITAAQTRLDAAMKKYMLENNTPYFDYPLDFDEYFLTTNKNILNQIKLNSIVRFKYGNSTLALSIKEYDITYGDAALPTYKITLTDDVSIVLNQIGQVAEGLSKLGSEVAALQAVYGIDIVGELNKKLSKVRDDTAQGMITFLKGLKIGSYVSGSSGAVLANDATTGKTTLEVDYIKARLKAYFETLEIGHTDSIRGKLIITPQGSITLDKVETADTYYRCYFLNDQDGKQVTNTFTVGSLAISQNFNIKSGVYSGVSNHYYWRKVVAVGDNYIDLSISDCDTSVTNDVPQAGDVVCQLGHATDATLQNAIIISSVDTFSPSIALYSGISGYSLTNKEYISYGVDKTTNKAYFNVYGNCYVGARDNSAYVKYTSDGVEIKGNLAVGTTLNGTSLATQISDAQANATTAANTALTNYAATVTNKLTALQSQIDGEIDSWFDGYDPTTSNAPASDWTTEEVRQRHANDTFTNSASGASWRWVKTNDTWGWTVITDTATQQALALAAKAQDTADGKRRVFTAQPTDASAYDVGDLWVNATYGTTYANDLLRCVTAKAVNIAFDIAHWELATKYTDDTTAQEAISSIAGYAYLKTALKENTLVSGGLIQSSLMSLGYSDTNNVFHVMSGTNGVYDASKTFLSNVTGGIAAWYGGDMVDKFDYGTYNATTKKWTFSGLPTSYAKGLDRMDGSGYRADGNLWWDKSGNVHADPLTFIVGEDTIKYYLKLFQLLYSDDDETEIIYTIPQAPFKYLVINDPRTNGDTPYLTIGQISIQYDKTNDALKIVKADGTAGNIYSTGWMSAEGIDTTSGGGGGLIQTVYGSSGLGSTYSDTTLTDTFNAYAINSIYNELQEVKAGALTSVSWGIISSKPTTIEGYGITDAKIYLTITMDR